jgi:hypothetical protein
MRTLEIAPPLKLADQRRTQRSIVEEVDRLLDDVGADDEVEGNPRPGPARSQARR